MRYEEKDDSPLKLESNGVDNPDPSSKDNTRRRLEPQSSSQVGKERANIHGIGKNVEWERSHTVGHEDTKVVTEISASDTQSPHGGNDKCLTRSEERNSSSLDSRVTEYDEGRLVLDSTKEPIIPRGDEDYRDQRVHVSKSTTRTGGL